MSTFKQDPHDLYYVILSKNAAKSRPDLVAVFTHSVADPSPGETVAKLRSAIGVIRHRQFRAGFTYVVNFHQLRPQ
jgi:hypothetical protein